MEERYNAGEHDRERGELDEHRPDRDDGTDLVQCNEATSELAQINNTETRDDVIAFRQKAFAITAALLTILFAAEHVACETWLHTPATVPVWVLGILTFMYGGSIAGSSADTMDSLKSWLGTAWTIIQFLFKFLFRRK